MANKLFTTETIFSVKSVAETFSIIDMYNENIMQDKMKNINFLIFGQLFVARTFSHPTSGSSRLQPSQQLHHQKTATTATETGNTAFQP